MSTPTTTVEITLADRARAALVGLGPEQIGSLLVAALGHPIAATTVSYPLLQRDLVTWDVETAHALSSPVDMQKITPLGSEAHRLFNDAVREAGAHDVNAIAQVSRRLTTRGR